MIRKILVAIDESAASDRAFAQSLEMAKALDAGLILVHALDVFDPASPEYPTIAVDSYSVHLDKAVRENYEKQWAEFVRHTEALIQRKQQEAEAIGLVAQYVQPYGRPGSAICKVAETAQADLIIVGSRGRSGIKEMLLGSVSNYIMHHAPCSVAVVHPHSHYASKAQVQNLEAVTA